MNSEIFKEVIRILKRDFINTVFTKKCFLCLKLMNYNEDEVLCEECRNNIPFVKPPNCIICGRHTEIEGVCASCKEEKFSFTGGFSVLEYSDDAKSSIHRFKYSGYREYSSFYAELIAEKFNRQDLVTGDLIIPVPIHKSKLRKRGYNQSTLIANDLSKIIKIPVDDEIIVRTEKTKPMYNLSKKERVMNVKNAFSVVNPEKIKGKTIILLDDIFTTGSTLNYCAKSLIDNGADEVFFITLSILQ